MSPLGITMPKKRNNFEKRVDRIKADIMKAARQASSCRPKESSEAR